MRTVRWAIPAAVIAMAGLAPSAPAPSAAPIVNAASTGCPPVSATAHSAAPGSGRTVALTFDDGPGPATRELLSILMREAVRATFFNTGTEIAERPGIVRSENRQGHTLGNHGWNHPDLPTLSASAQASQIDRTTAAQENAVGFGPCLFRPPYGNYTNTTLALAAARGLAVWTWSVDTEDWKAAGSTSSFWVHRIINRAEAGVTLQHPVILFHSATGVDDPATLAALPTIIDFYRDHGYAFVDLLGHRGLAPFAPAGAPAPAVAADAAGLHVFTRGGHGHVRERTRHSGRWSTARDLGGNSPRGPAAATLDRDTVLVAILDQQHAVEVRTITDNGLGAWTSLGGGFAGRPAVAVNRRSGTVTVVARRTDHTLAYRQRIAGHWQPWTSLGGRFTTAPAVVTTDHGGLTVAAVDASGVLWTRHWSDTWGSWHRVGGLTITADAALATTTDRDHLVALARSATGSIKIRIGSPDGTGWGGWQSLGGITASGPAATTSGSSLVVAVGGTDGHVYLDTAPAGATPGDWRGWQVVPD